MRLVFNGKIKDSGLYINNRNQFDKDILFFLNKDVTVTIEKKRNEAV